MADNSNKEFTNITDLLRQTAESVQQQKETKSAEEESQINDIFTDFSFDDETAFDDDSILEDVIPFEEAVLLQQKKQEMPRWIIIAGLTVVTVILIVIGYLYGARPLLYSIYFRKALAYLSENEPHKTNRALATALFFRTSPENTYTSFALECWKRGKFNEAANYLNIVKQINPYHFQMLNLSAKVSISIGEYDTARAYCEQMDKLNGITSESLYNRGEIYLLKNDFERAVESFERSRMYNPEDPAAYIKLRRLYLQLNEFDKALKTQVYLQNLKNAPPLDAEAYAAYGQIFIAKRDYEKAERFYSKSIEENPNQPELYLQLARIYKLQNRIDKVMYNYQKYLELRPNDAFVLSDLGYMYFKKRDIKNAALKLQHSLELDPKLPETHYYIAKLYSYVFNQYDYAIEEFKKSDELGLTIKDLKFHLSYAQYNSEKYSDSLESMMDFYNNDFGSSTIDTYFVVYNFGNIYMHNKKYESAVKMYEQLINYESDEKNNMLLYNNIGLAYELADNSDSALSYYWKTIEMQESFLDKKNEDFNVNISVKPKQNFTRLLSTNPNINDIKSSMEWEIVSPEIIK